MQTRRANIPPAAREHVKKRFMERYGMEMYRDDLERLILVAKKRGRTIRRLAKTRLLKFVEFDGAKIYYVWDERKKFFITVLTQEQVDVKVGEKTRLEAEAS